MQYDDLLEDELIDLTRAGNQDAFEEIAKRYRPRLYQTALIMLNSHSTAENAVRDTLANACKTLHEFQNQSLLLTWLCRKLIAHIFSKYLQQPARSQEQ